MALEQYKMIMPRVVYSGKNALNHLRSVVADAKKVAVITDNGLVKLGLVELPLAEIRAAGVDYQVFSDVPPEPAYYQVQKLVDQFQASGADFIVAVGGGSVMDTAKLASLLAGTEKYTVKDLLANPGAAGKAVSTCLIPTTAGTGSEATPNAIVGVPEEETKVGIVNTSMIPDYVILDAVMVKNLPRKIAAATGIDAMAHAIECYTGNQSNAFSDTVALEALDIIINNIEQACDDPDAMEAKNRMQIASFYGGVAIACSGTTAVHALSYPLGGKYHIAHGVANAIMLVPVLRFNEPVIRSRLASIYDRVVRGEKTCLTAEQKSSWIMERISQIVKHLEIPDSLAEFHVPKEDLELLVKAGMEQQRLLGNNMRPVTAEDARKIYMEIL